MSGARGDIRVTKGFSGSYRVYGRIASGMCRSYIGPQRDYMVIDRII